MIIVIWLCNYRRWVICLMLVFWYLILNRVCGILHFKQLVICMGEFVHIKQRQRSFVIKAYLNKCCGICVIKNKYYVFPDCRRAVKWSKYCYHWVLNWEHVSSREINLVAIMAFVKKFVRGYYIILLANALEVNTIFCLFQYS